MAGEHGVVFPEVDGRRSTSATGRAVVADALRPVDPVGADAAARETSWRSGYGPHFRRLVEAGLPSYGAARSIAEAGLASVHARMRWAPQDGEEQVLGAAMAGPLAEMSAGSAERVGTETVAGTGRPDTALTVPYRGRRLAGDDLRRQLDTWVAAGVVEPSLREAVTAVLENPDWLRLDGRTVVVLGAAAEMGPLRALLRWGATVAAVDLPRPDLWTRLLDDTRDLAGRLVVPVRPGPEDLPQRAGLDVLHDLPAASAWTSALPGPLVLGNYVYADGSTNVRVSVAVDALTEAVRRQRSEVALAFLATPTDVFAVPGAAVDAAVEAYAQRRTSKLLRVPLRTVSGGRLLRRNYLPGVDPGINDSVVTQQGPNYLLAKRVQRWRATAARAEGAAVSFKVAPPTRTRSVVRNRALAAAYSGAHRFGVEVFEPGTANTLMAALLVHDLVARPPAQDHPWQDEAFAAAHGGLWRCAYDPRSALGLAALLGAASAR
ncbi:Rossmann-fold NAD(P)-binding domain-containing protein [Phycicoccus flavus]|uniref:Uncharacterized protein n=1 Tax=Phycicoccus flavus TaxID=2502783 RepID=A0A8T6R3U3_9MICO|nr:hypothetical protein [Phycicoccus flavus]NHA67445.1 hypothetical protein [Phycicoccus flavus]